MTKISELQPDKFEPEVKPKRARRKLTPEERYAKFVKQVSKQTGISEDKLKDNPTIQDYYNINLRNLANGDAEQIYPRFFTQPVYDDNLIVAGEPNLLNPNYVRVNNVIVPKSILPPSAVEIESDDNKVTNVLFSEPQKTAENALKIAQDQLPYLQQNIHKDIVFTPYQKSQSLQLLEANKRNEAAVKEIKRNFKQGLASFGIELNKTIIDDLKRVLGATDANKLIGSVSRIEALYPTQSLEKVYSKVRDILEQTQSNFIVFDPVFESFLIYLSYNQLTKNQNAVVFEPNANISAMLQRSGIVNLRNVIFRNENIDVSSETFMDSIDNLIKTLKSKVMFLNLELFPDDKATDMLLTFIMVINKAKIYGNFELVVGLPYKLSDLTNIYKNSAFNYDAIAGIIIKYYTKFDPKGTKFDDEDIMALLDMLKGKEIVSTVIKEKESEVSEVVDKLKSVPEVKATEVFPDVPISSADDSDKVIDLSISYNLEKVEKGFSNLNVGDFFVILRDPLSRKQLAKNVTISRTFVGHPILLTSEMMTTRGIDMTSINGAFMANNWHKMKSGGYAILKDYVDYENVLKVIPSHKGKIMSKIYLCPQKDDPEIGAVLLYAKLKNLADITDGLSTSFIDYTPYETPVKLKKSSPLIPEPFTPIGIEPLPEIPITPTESSSETPKPPGWYDTLSLVSRKPTTSSKESATPIVDEETGMGTTSKGKGYGKIYYKNPYSRFVKIGDGENMQLVELPPPRHSDALEGGSILNSLQKQDFVRLFQIKYVSLLDSDDNNYYYRITI